MKYICRNTHSTPHFSYLDGQPSWRCLCPLWRESTRWLIDASQCLGRGKDCFLGLPRPQLTISAIFSVWKGLFQAVLFWEPSLAVRVGRNMAAAAELCSGEAAWECSGNDGVRCNCSAFCSEPARSLAVVWELLQWRRSSRRLQLRWHYQKFLVAATRFEEQSRVQAGTRKMYDWVSQ